MDREHTVHYHLMVLVVGCQNRHCKNVGGGTSNTWSVCISCVSTDIVNTYVASCIYNVCMICSVWRSIISVVNDYVECFNCRDYESEWNKLYIMKIKSHKNLSADSPSGTWFVLVLLPWKQLRRLTVQKTPPSCYKTWMTSSTAFINGWISLRFYQDKYYL